MAGRELLVVGAGIGGLGAAIAHARAGGTAQVVEIEDGVRPAGVGINQPGNSLRALDDLGVLEECLAAGYAFNDITHSDWHGTHVFTTTSLLSTERVPANSALARADLHDILLRAADREGVRIRYGVTLTDLEQDDDGVTVSFTDGTTGRYDAVAAFDGIKSAMRGRLFGDACTPQSTGYAVWRVTLPRPEQVTHIMLWHGVGSNTGVIPLSGESLYLFHVRPAEAGGRIDAAQLPGMLRDRLAGYGDTVGELRDQITADSDVVYAPLSEVHLPLPWHVGRVILLGDAAHASTPLLTQGAAMALEDGLVLADALAGDLPVTEALAGVGEHRLPRAGLVQEASRRNLEAGFASSEEELQRFCGGLAEMFPRMAGIVEGELAKPFRVDARLRQTDHHVTTH